MAPTTRDWLYCLASVALGALGYMQMTEVASPFMKPVLLACQNSDISPDEFVEITGYHAYDTEWGVSGTFDLFVCAITQFFHNLVQHPPGGTMVSISMLLTATPVLALITMEAGRKDAYGPVRYPMLTALLGQFVGIGVSIPLFWIPCYILGHGVGGISKARSILSILMPLTYLILATLAFWLNTETPLWTKVIAILGGPLIALQWVLLWPFGGHDPNDVKETTKSAARSAMTYATAGVLSLAMWLFLIFNTVIPEVGFNLELLYDTIWAQTTRCVQFMGLNCFTLWVSSLLLLAYHKETTALEGLALSLLFGPGAGTALALAGMQVDEEGGDAIHLDWTQENAKKNQ